MRLTALTLSGFKSFADKTTFDFHSGVTCIVGPNGCGKSNLVDAIKWVLGEQSAKSLRGGEMMDVIFNGTPSRRSAGLAEVTLTFEDAAGVLGELVAAAEASAEVKAFASAADEAAAAADAAVAGEILPMEGLTDVEEPKEAPKPRRKAIATDTRMVAITRRLYRNGDSEYLINNTPARLKDIREMFMDTGVGTDAYCLIEQGKVDVFLQSNPADRRAVFDEAAGISKYKARRREAERRLERVEQNLLRLSDVLGEVQKRLRSIKYQAGKARSYQTYTIRLKELRSLFALAEYHRHSQQRRQLQQQADGLNDALAHCVAQLERLTASQTATEIEIADIEQKVRTLDSRIAELSSQASTCEERTIMLNARVKELADSAASDSSRLEQAEARAEANREEREAHVGQLEYVEGELKQLLAREEAFRNEYASGAKSLDQLRRQLEDEKNGTIELLRRTAQLHNEVSTHSLYRQNLHSQRERLNGRANEIARTLEGLLEKKMAEQSKLAQVQAVLDESRKRLEEAHQQMTQVEQAASAIAADSMQAQRDHSGLLSRRSVLDEMQRRLEGIGGGVRRVLSAAAEGKLPFVRGMVGQFIDTDVAHAPIIEAAIAEAEQRLVVDRLEDVTGSCPVLHELLKDSDGVDLVCLDRLYADSAAELPVPAGEGVIGRASDWVRTAPETAALISALLGRTLVLDTLARAVEIARSPAGAGWRFVTQGGEVLESDGRVRIGSVFHGSGMIGRRSELAELARRLEESSQKLAQLDARKQENQGQKTHLAEVTQQLRTAIYEANAERVEAQTLLGNIDQEVAKLQREAPVIATEVEHLANQIDQTLAKERQAGEQAAQLESLKTQRDAEVARLTAAVARESAAHESLSGEMTAVRVAYAQARQKRDSLTENIARLSRAGESLSAECNSLRAQIEQSRQRKAEAEAAIVETAKQIESLLTEKASLEREAVDTAETRKGLHERLAQIRQEAAESRKKHDDLSAQLGELRVQLGEAEVRIEALITRTQEELSLNLLEACAGYQHDDQRDWEAVKAEINELREKLERLGNVNLDAIAEQDELTQREKFLAEQIEDIRSSQRQLSDLIKRINAESRRRFEESFQAVRANFNELFRKLFGGGKADIVLVNPEDVLESYIDIVARPPGKDTKSISLLSGGEKTMTALALLFSFFQAKPSPFCVLDEVDAALDEANTGRFSQLVREFLGTSQFVIVSHSKRTISMADQIYGVTMQQPGVSRRISVKFEDAKQLAEQPNPEPVPVG